MKPLHTFAEKREEKLSLTWLDENFQQALDLIDAQNARIEAQGRSIAALTAECLALKDALAKLGNTVTIVDRVLAKLREAP